MNRTPDATTDAPRRMAGDARREQLLAAGLVLFSTTPYDAVSVDAIAAATGTARGLLYHYFGSKRAFYIEVLEASAAELIATLEPSEPHAELGGLMEGLRRALVWIREHEAGYLTVLSGGIGTDPEVAQVIERVRYAIGDLVLTNIHIEDHARPMALAHVRGWVGYVEGVLPLLLQDVLTEDQVIELATHALYAWFGATDGIDVPSIAP
jgi:AcrR family transcriptional regulator